MHIDDSESSEGHSSSAFQLSSDQLNDVVYLLITQIYIVLRIHKSQIFVSSQASSA